MEMPGSELTRTRNWSGKNNNGGGDLDTGDVRGSLGDVFCRLARCGAWSSRRMMEVIQAASDAASGAVMLFDFVVRCT